MKKQVLAMLLAILLCVFLLCACDRTPTDATIDPDKLHPNENTGGQTPGGEDVVPDDEGGIGNNTEIELPFVPYG